MTQSRIGVYKLSGTDLYVQGAGSGNGHIDVPGQQKICLRLHLVRVRSARPERGQETIVDFVQYAGAHPGRCGKR